MQIWRLCKLAVGDQYATASLMATESLWIQAMKPGVLVRGQSEVNGDEVYDQHNLTKGRKPH